MLFCIFKIKYYFENSILHITASNAIWENIGLDDSTLLDGWATLPQTSQSMVGDDV